MVSLKATNTFILLLFMASCGSSSDDSNGPGNTPTVDPVKKSYLYKEKVEPLATNQDYIENEEFKLPEEYKSGDLAIINFEFDSKQNDKLSVLSLRSSFHGCTDTLETSLVTYNPDREVVIGNFQLGDHIIERNTTYTVEVKTSQQDNGCKLKSIGYTIWLGNIDETPSVAIECNRTVGAGSYFHFVNHSPFSVFKSNQTLFNGPGKVCGVEGYFPNITENRKYEGRSKPFEYLGEYTDDNNNEFKLDIKYDQDVGTLTCTRNGEEVIKWNLSSCIERVRDTNQFKFQKD